MNLFQGNGKLEEVIFTGLNYAFYSRHEQKEMLIPFMMLHKDGNSKLVRVLVDGDPLESFRKLLQNEPDSYDQIALCFEGRVPHNGAKQDALIVQGFDTSQEKGFMFLQRFTGIESGKPFQKLGNPALVSMDEVLPVPLVARTRNKSIEEPYVSAIAFKGAAGEMHRTILAGHPSPSILAIHLFEEVLNLLDRKEPSFSGKFILKFVPDSMPFDGFTVFIFNQLVQDLKSHPLVQNWEQQFKKTLRIELNYPENEGAAEIPTPSEAPKTESPKSENPELSLKSKQDSQSKNPVKPWWKFW